MSQTQMRDEKIQIYGNTLDSEDLEEMKDDIRAMESMVLQYKGRGPIINVRMEKKGTIVTRMFSGLKKAQEEVERWFQW